MSLKFLRKFFSPLILIVAFAMCIPVAAFAGANADDVSQASKQLEIYRKSQPIHEHKWSQLRQSLIEIEDAQVDTTATTTFFFNQGVVDPIDSCASIGFPIPTTDQLSNPTRTAGYHGGTSINQLESNGVYTGDSTGTYAMCVAGKGLKASYWEGFVKTESGVAHWDYNQHRIVREGVGTFTKGK